MVEFDYVYFWHKILCRYIKIICVFFGSVNCLVMENSSGGMKQRRNDSIEHDLMSFFVFSNVKRFALLIEREKLFVQKPKNYEGKFVHY